MIGPFRSFVSVWWILLIFFPLYFSAGGPHQSGQRDKHLHHPQRISGAIIGLNWSQERACIFFFMWYHRSVSNHFFSWQTYIKSMDKDFVAATIQAIGRCATNIGEVRDTCLNGLVQLLSNRDGESLCALCSVYYKQMQIFLQFMQWNICI